MSRVAVLMAVLTLGGCTGAGVGESYAPAYGYAGSAYAPTGYAGDYGPTYYGRPSYIGPTPSYAVPPPAYVGPTPGYYREPYYAGPGPGYGGRGYENRGYERRGYEGRGEGDRDRGGNWGAGAQGRNLERQQSLVQQQQNYNSQIVDAQKRYNDRISANPQGAPVFREQLAREAAESRRRLEQNTRDLR